MRGCRTHNLVFSYTCPACDEAYTYCGRAHLIKFFDAGVRNDIMVCRNSEQLAAYEHGQKYHKEAS